WDLKLGICDLFGIWCLGVGICLGDVVIWSPWSLANGLTPQNRLRSFVLADIKSQTAEELQSRCQEWGQPAYRVSQLLEWLYVRRVTDWEVMTNLPRALREQLRDHYSLQSLELVRKQGSRDMTQKFLWRLSDHSLIESVRIPA